MTPLPDAHDGALTVDAIARLRAQDHDLSEQIDDHYSLPIIDVVGAAEERDEEYQLLKAARKELRQQYPAAVDFLLAEVARLTAQLARATKALEPISYNSLENPRQEAKDALTDIARMETEADDET